ncbi:MAG: hypothetical protein L3K14_06935 [Thermoplasmata archaeon]|nr:hypothetical protein [Thermoplasmata archaeon]
MGGSLPRPSSFPKLSGTARTAAIEEPGASWREYLYLSLAKAWVLLGFGVVDAWIISAWLQPPNVLALGLTLAGAFYLEFLLFRYLWYRPGPDESASTGPFRPSWTRPVRFGRWTPETWRLRDARARGEPAEHHGPDPSEFL